MSRSPLRALAALVAAALLLLTVSAAAQAQSGARIVALTPFTANVLVALGVRPVAIGSLPSGETRVSKRLRDVKRLALSHTSGGPNLEQLALLNPELVLSAPVWQKSANGMKELGVRVVMSDPQKVSDIPRQTTFIGSVVGRRKEAERFAEQQRRSIRAAQKKIKRRPKVLVVLGVGRQTLAFLPNSWGGDLVISAGGRLLTQGLTDGKASIDGFAPLQAEAVLKANPDVIIAVPHGNTQDLPKVVSYLRTNPAWQGTKAQRNGRIYVSTDNSLLQPWETAATSIYDVQTKFLRNR